jgi:acid phosphatase family membrane protein YuiD
MNNFSLIFQNKVLITALTGWACSQILKPFTFMIVNKRFDASRLTGDGGMPSSHSTFVTSAAVAAGLNYGWDSPVFAIMTVIAFIVMHDAMNVRYETGKQSKVLNELIEKFNMISDHDVTLEKKLEEFVGHTPLQVAAGFCLGLVVALIVNR